MPYTDRTLDYVITRAYVHAQRKGTAPTVGTDKYTVLVAIADSMQKDWADEANIEWNSLYEVVDSGTISATDTFDLDDTINYISKREGDKVLVTNGTQTATYSIVSPNQLYQYRDAAVCAQIGRTLKFSKAFRTTDSTIGYTLKIPSMVYVDDLTTGTDIVQVDDAQWLVYMIAAEFVRNDSVKATQYDNLLALAENKMQKMKANNGGSFEEISRPWMPEGASWL